ncbi:MAG: ferredoxin family protein [Promethearchaeota archaeon]
MTATIIPENCTRCGWCVTVCPHQIIMLQENEKARITNPEKCIECGACSLQCHVNAIITHPEGCGCVGSVLKTKVRKLLKLKTQTTSTCCR